MALHIGLSGPSEDSTVVSLTYSLTYSCYKSIRTFGFYNISKLN